MRFIDGFLGEAWTVGRESIVANTDPLSSSLRREKAASFGDSGMVEFPSVASKMYRLSESAEMPYTPPFKTSRPHADSRFNRTKQGF
jgi:hypothetical protein